MNTHRTCYHIKQGVHASIYNVAEKYINFWQAVNANSVVTNHLEDNPPLTVTQIGEYVHNWYNTLLNTTPKKENLQMKLKWNVKKLPLPKIFNNICSPAERDAFQAFLYRHGVLNTSTVLHTDTSIGEALLVRIRERGSWQEVALKYGFITKEEKHYHLGDIITYHKNGLSPTRITGRLVGLDSNIRIGIAQEPPSYTILMGDDYMVMSSKDISKSQLEQNFHITIQE